MEISIDWRDDRGSKTQTVAFFCDEPDLKKMVKFIKYCEKHPLCYSCDSLKYAQMYFEGKPEEIRQLIKDLKRKGCSFEREENPFEML